MTSNGELVLVQVSGGNEDMLKPGLNIIGGMQPRGPRAPIFGIPGDSDIVGIAEWASTDFEGNSLRTLLMDVAIMSCMSLPFKTFILCIPDICGISDAADRDTEAVTGLSGSIPSPAPAFSTSSGRHLTLPRPLASILSTQDGNAPVLMYRAKMTSESSCVQSFKRMFVACRSASRRAAFSLSF